VLCGKNKDVPQRAQSKRKEPQSQTSRHTRHVTRSLAKARDVIMDRHRLPFSSTNRTRAKRRIIQSLKFYETRNNENAELSKNQIDIAHELLPGAVFPG
jgi:hypothetical protein